MRARSLSKSLDAIHWLCLDTRQSRSEVDVKPDPVPIVRRLCLTETLSSLYYLILVPPLFLIHLCPRQVLGSSWRGSSVGVAPNVFHFTCPPSIESHEGPPPFEIPKRRSLSPLGTCVRPTTLLRTDKLADPSTCLVHLGFLIIAAFHHLGHFFCL